MRASSIVGKGPLVASHACGQRHVLLMRRQRGRSDASEHSGSKVNIDRNGSSARGRGRKEDAAHQFGGWLRKQTQTRGRNRGSNARLTTTKGGV